MVTPTDDLSGSRQLPDFLGIGAQKAGTTWLDRNLRQHPEIWLPPVKELHYFNRLHHASPSPLTTTPILLRFFSQRHADQLWRRELTRAILNIRRMSRQEVLWYSRFFFARYDDRWYASLFEGRPSQVTGEITPAYSILEDETIEQIHGLMPNARILFIMRNPIERAWSAVRNGIRQMARKGRFDLEKEGPELVQNLPPEKLERLFERIRSREEHALRSDYVRTIENWSACFPRVQFFIGFFDDIVESPRSFLRTVFEFLEVDSSTSHITQMAFRRVNPSPKKAIPPQLERRLAEEHYPQIQQLNKMVGGPTDRWLREAERILQRRAG